MLKISHLGQQELARADGRSRLDQDSDRICFAHRSRIYNLLKDEILKLNMCKNFMTVLAAIRELVLA